VLPVAPDIGVAVLPLVPTYHWNESGAVPLAVTVIVVDEPAVIVPGLGFGPLVTAGGVHVLLVTVTVAVELLTLPQELETRTQ